MSEENRDECAFCGCHRAFHVWSDGEYSRPCPCRGEVRDVLTFRFDSLCSKNCERFIPLNSSLPESKVPSDTERLDWLDLNAGKRGRFFCDETGAWAFFFKPSRTEFTSTATAAKCWKPTIREAIDYAMKEESP